MATLPNYAMFYGSKDGDRKYNAASFENWLKPFFTTGVFQGDLQVTANNDLTVSIGAGYVNIEGKVKVFTETATLDLETPSGTLDRIDSVIVRRNDTDRDINIMIVKGGNAASPVAPTVTREGAFYDLKLADIYVSKGALKITQADITDQRMNAAVCGWVVATVKEIDFTQIQAQFNDFFAQYKKNISDSYSDYLNQINDFEDQGSAALALMKKTFEDYEGEQKQIYEDWIAKQEADFTAWQQEVESQFSSWRQNQEGTFNNWYVTNTGKWKEEILSWFEDIKGQISEDAAANIQLQLNDIRNALLTSQVQVETIGSDGAFIVGSDGARIGGFWTIRTSDTCDCNSKV